MSERFTCARRADVFAPGAADSGKDFYRNDGTCSYCGSMSGDEFMRRLEAGTVQLGPTDKNYKVYVHEAPDEEVLRLRKESSANTPHAQALIRDKGLAAFEKYWESERGMVTGADLGKFYFQHLSYYQMRRFVELLNDKKIKFGYPGHLYTRPYFVRYDEPSPAAP